MSNVNGRRRVAGRALAGLAVAALLPTLIPGCFERSDRWLAEEPPPPACITGTTRCTTNFERCVNSPAGPRFEVVENCRAQGLVCALSLGRCAPCIPNETACDGQTVLRCDEHGEAQTPERTCDVEAYEACRHGACVHLCAAASTRRSNVGCEYWAVDLDNARIDDTSNAAAQQFAVVVSNPQPDVSTRVVIEQDDSQPGQDNAPIVVAEASIPPFSLRVFKLGPREVDGSPPGQYNAGTHTALTRAAFRVTTTFPVVAYQFNPLENVNVFSNDASLLKPVEAVMPLGSTFEPAYVVLGWPQTIASTDDPNTNFNPRSPIDLRAFLTIVGTRPNTRVRVHTATRILGGGPIADTPAGEDIEFSLDPFDVMNLETDDFNADFTGSLISATGPVIVFSGSEASDAPFFETLSRRRCCADHLEEQLDHIRTSGKHFVATVSPNRAAALIRAGAPLGIGEQSDYFRVIATTEAGATVKTSLGGTRSSIVLPARGSFADLKSSKHFTLESDQPIMLMSTSPSQADANVPSQLPGGDPSTLLVPPIEQFRSSYVFLVPDKYNFDFVQIVATPTANIVLDGTPLPEVTGCTSAPADGLTLQERGGVEPAFVVHTCQLSFPIFLPDKARPENLLPGRQNDNVHRIEADEKVGVLVNGFDYFVSYAYAAGTELEFIVPP
jgi:hypothetical protein